MIKYRSLLAVVLITVLWSACKEVQGPTGPPGSESLTDPAVQPKVFYTYPPANTQGPYDAFFYNNSQIQVRFNKIMDRVSVGRAVNLSSPHTTVRIDTGNIYSVGGDEFGIYVYDPLSSYYSYRWKVGETYSFTIASSAKDINGNSLLPAYAMTFAPEPYFRIRSVYPSDGATNVSLSSSIDLYFNGPVDTSIFSKITISPSVPGQWEYNDSTQIYYSYYLSPLKANTTYTIAVSANARDKYGNQLPQRFTSSFTTAPFQVTSTYPSNGSINVPLFNSIEVDFNSPIDTGTVRSAFKLTPTTSGYFSMYDGSSYFTFYPTNELLADTTYSVTVDTSLRSKSGDKLLAPYTFSFATVPFQVTGTYPSNGATYVDRYIRIEVDFSDRIDTGSVRGAFSMKDAMGSIVVGGFSSYSGINIFYFYPNSILAANMIYTATISIAMRSQGGQAIKAPYTFSFTTGN